MDKILGLVCSHISDQSMLLCEDRLKHICCPGILPTCGGSCSYNTLVKSLSPWYTICYTISDRVVVPMQLEAWHG